MSAASIAWNGIVVEVLNKENYLDWSALVENYLKGKGLWYNIIEDNTNDDAKDPAVWESKNRRALHAIQLSCGMALAQIRNFGTAKAAWVYLRTTFSEEVKAHHDPTQTRSSDIDRVSLQNLVRKGFLDDAKSSINISPQDIFSLSPDGRTVLHAAVAAGHVEVVNKLVKMGKQRLLRMQDKKGYTALALAAKLTDNREMAELMVTYGGNELLTIAAKAEFHRGVEEIPLLLASDKDHKEMTRYLFKHTPWSLLCQNGWQYGVVLLSRCIYNEIFDVAAAILRHQDARLLPLYHPNKGLEPIYALAHIPSAFPSTGTELNWFQQFIYNSLRIETNEDVIGERIEIVSNVGPDEEGKYIGAQTLAGRLFGQFQQFIQTSILLKFPVFQKIYEEKRNQYLVLEILNCMCKRISTLTEADLHSISAYDAMLHAAKYGMIEFIKSMYHANPDLLLAMDQSKRGIFAHAIVNRQEEVFQLIHTIKSKEIITSSDDALGNNMLHMAAELGPSRYLNRMPNAALQMQRELHWFQEVKKVVPRWCCEAENKNGKKPSEVFTDEHKELLKSGQQWAKETASSFIVVGTVIITVMFAAAFTVPGGNNSNNGVPVFLGKDTFTIFIICVALSLVTSSSSVLMFIGILTSSFNEEDFNKSLPLKLFFAVASMMCAFGAAAALALMLRGYRLIVTAMWLALLPILVFDFSLLRLAAEILKSTVRFDY